LDETIEFAASRRGAWIAASGHQIKTLRGLSRPRTTASCARRTGEDMASHPLGHPHRYSSTLVSRASAIVGAAAAPPTRLSALEWSIVAMAEKDGLSSIREAGRYSRALRSFFGFRQPNRLANERLEVLRRIAILAWHYGWNVPNSELASFFAAGFSSDQFELIQTSLGQARTASRRRRAR
jgi:hypothetical protein